ncbi:glycosyl hydrolase family 18 protein [Longimicrobium sp.]|uniref:glycosyl hydrolase family 18 protein n=1 Tax=Longimicrobium sp. TaxID=2029185 RepID=UPI002E3551A9|nr:glycosyl hydrolase family 18 protein [Longimicrobium sp.]HEX6039444.1 glycosyl hydrolase family 18 protein [Longimicrobium sp.]
MIPIHLRARRLLVAGLALLSACSGGDGGPTGSQSTAPGAPRNASATPLNARATIQWSAPESDGGSPVLRYRVAAVPGGASATVDAPATSATVAGLTNGTAYTFTVVAVNAVGEGTASVPTTPVTPREELAPGPPDAPTNVQATAGNAQATVSWTAPARTGGSPLRRFRVTAAPGGATVTVDAPAAVAVVGGLANGTAYTFTVVAVTDAGESAASAPSAAVTPTSAGPAARWVSGYYVGYQRDLYPPDQVDMTLMTHLVVGRIRPAADGSVIADFDIDDVNGPAMARTLSTRAHAAGIKAILMLGGSGEYAGFVGAASPANRARFVTNLLRVMDELGYDGLDVDWEPIQAADRAPLLALLQALRAARPGIILTVPVGWINNNFRSDADAWYAQLANAVDQMNLMTYDMAGNWGGWESWHHSALYDEAPHRPSSVSSSVQAYLDAGVPAAKIGIGIGFYGSCWRGVTEPRVALDGRPGVSQGNSDNDMSYTSIMTRYMAPGARRWDTAARVPYLSFPQGTGPQNCSFVSYEDEESIAAKGQFVRSRGLGGTIIWTIGQGRMPAAPAGSRDPLLKAVHQAFLAP